MARESPRRRKSVEEQTEAEDELSLFEEDAVTQTEAESSASLDDIEELFRLLHKRLDRLENRLDEKEQFSLNTALLLAGLLLIPLGLFILGATLAAELCLGAWVGLLFAVLYSLQV